MTLHANLSGKRVMITGASSGLGAHFARVLADAGAEIILVARRASLLEALVDDLASGGAQATMMVVDLTSSGSVSTMWNTAGAVDILVNNAGVALAKPLLDQDEADWEQVVGTNLKAAFLVATGAARLMRETGRGGSIINVASILGLRQGGQVATYAISKAGVVQMTKVMALELARYGIRVNALCPGYFATDLNKELWNSEAGQALIRRVPQRRLGDYQDLDGPLLLLASDASRFMTGTELVVDGGHLVSAL